MKLGVASVLAALVMSCGPTGPGDGGDEGPDTSGDTDMDGISNNDEGEPDGTDTDGDGTPDFSDSDSDGDGIPDYIEAGDANVDTDPADSDNDGTPDFRDLDSDGNGRSDADDGAEDQDADGVRDFADQDDDGDNIGDTLELGADVANPIDSDGDGTPDFRDMDSDNDTIKDVDETAQDFDMDGAGNYLDSDSDGDCVPDQAEARGLTPPADTDADGRPDFVDRDSDNDGIADGDEDANCNGAVDGGESSASDEDSDDDGVSDLIETAAGTDPTDPSSNPQANGDFVFLEPYQEPQSPTEDDLDFSTSLKAVDIYVLLDRSGSMSAEIASVKANLSAVVANLSCSSGLPNCIPDLWAGAATFGYSSSGAQAFQNWVDVQPNANFAPVVTSEPPGGSTREATNYALLAAITGEGGAAYGLSSVPARATCAGSPAGAAGFGYGCFRPTALPVVLLATDEPPISSGDTYTTPNFASVVAPQYTTRAARVVGILGDGAPASVGNDLRSIATATGAVDAGNGNAPLVFNGFGAGASTAIENGIRTLAAGLPIDINAVTVDDAADAVDAVAAFVDHLETLQLGTPECANGLTAIDTNADSFADQFVQVRAGTPVCWKVVSKQNTTVPATDQPQLFKATVAVYGDGVTQLDTRDVYFLVPPRPLDGPIGKR